MFVDSHVNLHGEKYDDDLDDVIQRARENGIGTMLNICGKVSEFDAVVDVAERYAHMWATVGTHPHDAHENPDITPDTLIRLSEHPKVIGIGETGLDFHYNYSEKEDQYKNFQAHIIAARTTQLPLIIHSRNADEDMIQILETEMKIGEFPALLHCYTSGKELARRAADIGVYFSLSGILTFKNAHDLRDIAQTLPNERLLIETDCPYLSPVPYRGRRNEPAFVPYVAEKLAEIKGWSVEDCARYTTDAFFTLFKKAERPKGSV